MEKIPQVVAKLVTIIGLDRGPAYALKKEIAFQ